MADAFNARAVRGRAPGDGYDREAASANLPTEIKQSVLDGAGARAELSKLLGWFYYERERQMANRLEMALDGDFYDGLQWDPEDVAELKGRGQMPLVYNEVAPMVDWLIGTERRARVDWRVLPRTEEGVALADVKTKVLKYVADTNHVAFARSRAFADAVKVGVGWLDDGVRDDPTQDVLYSKYEDWRNVLWDSNSYEPDLTDARYVFRWRWVDEDVALLMFPERAEQVLKAAEEDSGYGADWDEDGVPRSPDLGDGRSGVIYARGIGVTEDARRRRVRLIECQYRKPATVKIVTSGPLKGAIFNDADELAGALVGEVGGSIIDRVMMRVHVAVFTPANLLSLGPSIFRHNRYSLTPIWCYRRGRDRMPYGAVRRVRDIQQDLNKRASKALFLVNTNQVIAEEDAVEDWNVAREETDRPDGTVVVRPNKRYEIRRDTDAATGQIQMLTLAAQSIQKTAGVSNENLGRQTNATSGEAIKARQLQGSVVTTEPFDNLRMAVQAQGEKQLSLIEQWYTEEKVIRLTGFKGRLEWVKVNAPERQPDGSVRLLNDITASAADFIVSEQDYAGTMRQAMFDSLSSIAGHLPPEVALRLLTIAWEFSDMPNKDEIAEQFRKMTGERDPNQEPTPEEQQAMQQQAQQQQAALKMQQEQMVTAMEAQQAKIREINARAAKLEAEAGEQGGQGGADAGRMRAQADAEIAKLTEQLRAVQAEARQQIMRIKQDADVRVEVARIGAATDLRIAEIQSASNRRLAAIKSSASPIQSVTPSRNA